MISTTLCGSSAAASRSARKASAFARTRDPTGLLDDELHPPRRGVEDDEARVPVGEVEVARAVDLGPCVRAARVVEVVVADRAQVRYRQILDPPQVLLVALALPGQAPLSPATTNENG